MRPLALKGHERAITRVRLNREGDILFSASKVFIHCRRYTENGERIGTYEGHSGVVWDIDVSWDTQTMVSASGDQKVMVWDIETGVSKGFSEPGSVVRSIGLSYSGNLVVFTLNKPTTGGLPGIVVADLRDKMTQPILRDTFDDQCNACLFSHLDDHIVAGDHTGQLAMWDLRQPGAASNFTHPHKYQINDLQITADQTFIITASKDKTAQLHSAHDLQHLKTYKSNRPVNTASVSPSRDHIVLGGGEEHMEVTQTATTAEQFVARLYHLIFEEEFARFRGHFGPINSIIFDPTGDIVVSGGEDGYVRVQELDQSYKEFHFDIS